MLKQMKKTTKQYFYLKRYQAKSPILTIHLLPIYSLSPAKLETKCSAAGVICGQWGVQAGLFQQEVCCFNERSSALRVHLHCQIPCPG